MNPSDKPTKPSARHCAMCGAKEGVMYPCVEDKPHRFIPVEAESATGTNFVGGDGIQGPSCKVCGATMRYRCLSCGSTPVEAEQDESLEQPWDDQASLEQPDLRPNIPSETVPAESGVEAPPRWMRDVADEFLVGPNRAESSVSKLIAAIKKFAPAALPQETPAQPIGWEVGFKAGLNEAADWLHMRSPDHCVESAIRALKPLTRLASSAPAPVPAKGTCAHDRLDEEGFCRKCGADMRSGIDLSPAPSATRARELSPCPFCGGDAYDTKTVNGTNLWKIGCAACGFEFKCALVPTVPGSFDWSKDIATAWNKRINYGALLSTVRWIAGQTNLFFAECSQAEEIVARCKEALSGAAFAQSPAAPSGVPNSTDAIPVCRECGQPSPWGDPCEKCRKPLGTCASRLGLHTAGHDGMVPHPEWNTCEQWGPAPSGVPAKPDCCASNAADNEVLPDIAALD